MKGHGDLHGLVLMAGPLIDRWRELGTAAQVWMALALWTVAVAGVGYAIAGWRGTPGRIAALEDSSAVYSAAIDSLRVSSDSALMRVGRTGRQLNRHIDSVSVPGLAAIEKNREEVKRLSEQFTSLRARLYGVLTRMDTIAARVDRGNSLLRRLLCRRAGTSEDACELQVYGSILPAQVPSGPQNGGRHD